MNLLRKNNSNHLLMCLMKNHQRLLNKQKMKVSYFTLLTIIICKQKSHIFKYFFALTTEIQKAKKKKTHIESCCIMYHCSFFLTGRCYTATVFTSVHPVLFRRRCYQINVPVSLDSSPQPCSHPKTHLLFIVIGSAHIRYSAINKYLAPSWFIFVYLCNQILI